MSKYNILSKHVYSDDCRCYQLNGQSKLLYTYIGVYYKNFILIISKIIMFFLSPTNFYVSSDIIIISEFL